MGWSSKYSVEIHKWFKVDHYPLYELLETSVYMFFQASSKHITYQNPTEERPTYGTMLDFLDICCLHLDPSVPSCFIFIFHPFDDSYVGKCFSYRMLMNGIGPLDLFIFVGFLRVLLDLHSKKTTLGFSNDYVKITNPPPTWKIISKVPSHKMNGLFTYKTG